MVSKTAVFRVSPICVRKYTAGIYTSFCRASKAQVIPYLDRRHIDKMGSRSVFQITPKGWGNNVEKEAERREK
jgi:hypothetical protein